MSEEVTYTYPAGGWVFELTGNGFMTVRPAGILEGPDGWVGAHPVAYVVNVYDYEAGKPAVRTAAQLRARAKRWIAEDAPDAEAGTL